MALTTLDGLIAAMAASTSQRRSWLCDNTLGNSTSMWYDHWFATHTWGLAATPATGAGELLTSASAGAIPLTAPAGGHNLYLAGLDVDCNLVVTVMLYDRLWQVGGLDQSSTLTQTINGATMTRPDANGNDVEVWCVAQTAGNFFAPTLTLHYKDAAGVDHTADTIMPSSTLHNQYAAFPLNLAAGDNQVASVVSVKLNSAGTATTFCLVALRRLTTLAISQTWTPRQKDALQCALATIDSGACLAFMVASAGAAGGELDCRLAVVEG